MSVEFEGGAGRSERYVPLWLCPIELIQAVADTRLYGDQKYEPGNWQQGDKHFFVDCLSHAIQHLYDYAMPPEGDQGGEYHLGHAATNISFVLWALKRGKIDRADFFNVAKLSAPAENVSVNDAKPAEKDEVLYCENCGGKNTWNRVLDSEHICGDCMADRAYNEPPVPVQGESMYSQLLKKLGLGDTQGPFSQTK